MRWECAKARLDQGFIVRRKKWTDGHYWMVDGDGRVYATRPYIGGYVNVNYYVTKEMLDEASKYEDWQYYKPQRKQTKGKRQ